MDLLRSADASLLLDADVARSLCGVEWLVKNEEDDDAVAMLW